MQDPETYLNELGVELECAVVPGAPARIAPELRARVNHEIYWFSGPDARRAFLRHPLRYCGVVTDPVSGVRFRPGAESPRAEHAGRPYFFASDSTRAAFVAAPETYADPEARMMDADGAAEAADGDPAPPAGE